MVDESICCNLTPAIEVFKDIMRLFDQILFRWGDVLSHQFIKDHMKKSRISRRRFIEYLGAAGLGIGLSSLLSNISLTKLEFR